MEITTVAAIGTASTIGGFGLWLGRLSGRVKKLEDRPCPNKTVTRDISDLKTTTETLKGDISESRVVDAGIRPEIEHLKEDIKYLRESQDSNTKILLEAIRGIK